MATDARPTDPPQGTLEVRVTQLGPIPLDADFRCAPGELLALVGPSGSGKTTLLRAIAGLYRPADGLIRCGDETWFEAAGAQWLGPQHRRVGLVFQDYALFPHLDARANVMVALSHLPSAQRREAAEAWLARVRLGGLGDRLPAQLSGGQCQRVALARALALHPRLLVLDEPTSALDVSVQAQIISLLAELREAYQLTYLFISHDLGVVRYISNRIAVMYLGKLVEVGPTAAVFESPLHPYTQALLASVPIPEPRFREWRFVLEGTVPSPANPPPGCRFHTRCPSARTICQKQEPALHPVSPDRRVACHEHT